MMKLFNSCHTSLDYSLASTFLSRCCHNHLQGSLPVIKVTVIIIVVIAFATSIAEDSPDQIYFSPGHQPGRFRSLVSANGQGSSFQLLFRSSKISPSTLHFPFALIPNLIRTNLKLGLFFNKNCVCDTGKILTPVKNVLITNKPHISLMRKRVVQV